MYSIKLINVHFWLATIGTVLYIVASMWIPA
jgi:cytochrome c oxidase cbb3-type subunit 1